jgi:hypothetical protein
VAGVRPGGDEFQSEIYGPQVKIVSSPELAVPAGQVVDRLLLGDNELSSGTASQTERAGRQVCGVLVRCSPESGLIRLTAFGRAEDGTSQAVALVGSSWLRRLQVVRWRAAIRVQAASMAARWVS